MEQSELLRFVVSVLERLDVRYFVTGSTVTIFYEEPRFTNDIDIVVDLPAAAVFPLGVDSVPVCSSFIERARLVMPHSKKRV